MPAVRGFEAACQPLPIHLVSSLQDGWLDKLLKYHQTRKVRLHLVNFDGGFSKTALGQC